MSDVKSGWFKRRRSKANSKHQTTRTASAKRRRGMGIIALEPRMMYDAAAVATVAAAQNHADVAGDHAVVAAAADRPTARITSNSGAEPVTANGAAPAVAAPNVTPPTAPVPASE